MVTCLLQGMVEPFQLTPLLERAPKVGLRELATERFGQLSEGQRRRLLIARFYWPALMFSGACTCFVGQPLILFDIANVMDVADDSLEATEPAA